MQRRIKLDHVNGALGNASVTPIVVDLPQGMSYVRIEAICGGTMTVAKVASHSVKADGKLIVPEISGTYTQRINRFNQNDKYSATVLQWFFGQSLADSLHEKRAGELSTFAKADGSTRFKSLKWTIVPDGTQDATGTIEFWAVLDDEPKPDFPGSNVDGDLMFRALRKSNALTATAAGDVGLEVDFGEVNAGGFNYMRQLHIMHANGTHLAIKRDSRDMLEKSTVAAIQLGQNERNRTSQASHLCVDFTAGGREFDSLPPKNEKGGLANMSWLLTLSAADTVYTFSDLYASIDRL